MSLSALPECNLYSTAGMRTHPLDRFVLSLEARVSPTKQELALKPALCYSYFLLVTLVLISVLQEYSPENSPDADPL